MKKNIKFLFILTMFLVLIINTYCFAIDMNLTMNNQAGNNELEVQTNEVNAENNNSIDTSVQNSENNTEETNTPSNAPSVVTTTTSNSNNFFWNCNFCTFKIVLFFKCFLYKKQFLLYIFLFFINNIDRL